MSYFLVAAICAVIGIVPLLVSRKFVMAAVVGVLGFLLLWLIFFLTNVTFMAPYLGGVVFWTILLWTGSAIIAVVDTNDEVPAGAWCFTVPAVYVILLLGSFFVGSGFVRANDYAALIGPTDQKVWTRDSQPKDPHHVRLLDAQTAVYIAKKYVGTLGAVGSQYNLATNYMTLQRVNGDFKYVVPLDFSGFGQWTNNGSDGVPAYMIIDAQDPYLSPTIVKLPEGKRLVYTPGAFFGSYLTRHLRQNGITGIADVNFELDDQGHPWWVVSTFTRTIVWNGAQLHDVVLVDPTSGAITHYALNAVPAWVDRVMPESLVQGYLSSHGKYARGWGNSFWSKQGITRPEISTLIYGTGDKLEWVTGITSDTSHDDSLVGIAYTDSRTGRTTIYQVNGGATDTAVQAAANANAYAKQFKLTAGTPQIYNIYGEMTAVVPLMNDTDAYQGTALVSVRDPQIVGVGQDTDSAASNYQAALFRTGQQALPGIANAVLTLKGTVDRIRQDVGPTGSQYYLHLAGVHRLFVVSSLDQANAKITLTQPGDAVTIEYVATGDPKVPVKHFDNLSLPLDQTPIQASVAASAVAKHDKADTHDSAEDVRHHLADMNDTDLLKAVKPK